MDALPRTSIRRRRRPPWRTQTHARYMIVAECGDRRRGARARAWSARSKRNHRGSRARAPRREALVYGVVDVEPRCTVPRHAAGGHGDDDRAVLASTCGRDLGPARPGSGHAETRDAEQHAPGRRRSARASAGRAEGGSAARAHARRPRVASRVARRQDVAASQRRGLYARRSASCERRQRCTMASLSRAPRGVVGAARRRKTFRRSQQPGGARTRRRRRGATRGHEKRSSSVLARRARRAAVLAQQLQFADGRGVRTRGEIGNAESRSTPVVRAARRARASREARRRRARGGLEVLDTRRGAEGCGPGETTPISASGSKASDGLAPA